MFRRVALLRTAAGGSPQAVDLGGQTFFDRIRDLPPRSASFANRPGPVAWVGINDERHGAPSILRRSMVEFANKSSTDFYSDVQWWDAPAKGAKAIEAPPLTVTMTPVMDCGDLTPLPTDNTYGLVSGIASSLTEKGYLPMFVGGSLSTTLPMVEGIKSVVPDDVVVLHFGADTGLGSDVAPLKVLLEKRLVKGIVQFGCRGVNATARSVRKEFQVRYADANSLYSRGSFTVKDVRNDFPTFLSIDASVLDPAFAPGVPFPEPAGLSTRDLIHLVSVMRGTRIVGLSITGFDPRYDHKPSGDMAHRGTTALALSKIAKEAILKAYSISTKTAAEGMAHIQELKKQGQHPERYPDF